MAVPSTFRLVTNRQESHAARQMAEDVRAAPEKAKLTREGFDKFLFRLDSDRDAGAESTKFCALS